VRLRQERNALAALAELDAYATRFPSGVLLPEAQRVRVDALLMDGRLSEARKVLSALELGASARDRELRLIRAELLAAHACAAALPDFQIVLAEKPGGPLAERALWGRAACLTQLGDEAGARRDLAAYIARFPGGAHSAAAHARLRD
jgi:TolA-binding protein